MYKSNIFSCFIVIIVSLYSTYVFSATPSLDQVIDQSKVPKGVVSDKSEIASDMQIRNRLSALRISYSKAMKEAVRKHWNTKHISKQFKCEVEFTQAPGGVVIDIAFLDCPSNMNARRSIELALRKEPLPYQSFEEVFSRRNITTFCASCEESKLSAEILPLHSLGTARIANDMTQQPTDITKQLSYIRKMSPDHLPPLFTIGNSGEFSVYLMQCLKTIVLTVNKNPNFPLQMPSGSSITFSVLIMPDGTLNALQINYNTGTPELEAILREAINQSAPFSRFPDALIKKHSAVLLTHTLGYVDCKASNSNCSIEL